MADAGFFRGTNAEQDSRFFNKEKKLLKSIKVPPIIETKVDMSKVNLDVIKPWITRRITELLGMEDDVVIEFCFNLLEKNQFPDGRDMQMNLMGFLYGKNARIFMHELWTHLISAQESVTGIPAAFIEEKKQEILEKQKEEERIKASVKKHIDQSKEIVDSHNKERIEEKDKVFGKDQRQSKSPQRIFKSDIEVKRHRSRSPQDFSGMKSRYLEERDKYYREREKREHKKSYHKHDGDDRRHFREKQQDHRKNRDTNKDISPQLPVQSRLTTMSSQESSDEDCHQSLAHSSVGSHSESSESDHANGNNNEESDGSSSSESDEENSSTTSTESVSQERIHSIGSEVSLPFKYSIREKSVESREISKYCKLSRSPEKSRVFDDLPKYRSTKSRQRSSRSPGKYYRSSRSPRRHQKSSRSPMEYHRSGRSPRRYKKSSRSPKRHKRSSRSPRRHQKSRKSPKRHHRSSKSLRSYRRSSKSPKRASRLSISPKRSHKDHGEPSRSKKHPDKYSLEDLSHKKNSRNDEYKRKRISQTSSSSSDIDESFSNSSNDENNNWDKRKHAHKKNKLSKKANESDEDDGGREKELRERALRSFKKKGLI